MNQIKRYFSIKRFKTFTKQSMLMISTFYIIGFNPINSYDELLKDPQSRSWTLIYAMLIYGLIYFIFYWMLNLLLRYLFHSKLRSVARAEREDTLTTSTFKDKKDSFLFTNNIASIIHKYIVSMGFIKTRDLQNSLILTVDQKEELFNKILEEQYSWVTLLFHSLITTLVVFKFYAWWFILLMIIAILVMLFFTILSVYLIINIDSIELVRKQLSKQSINLM